MLRVTTIKTTDFLPCFFLLIIHVNLSHQYICLLVICLKSVFSRFKLYFYQIGNHYILKSKDKDCQKFIHQLVKEFVLVTYALTSIFLSIQGKDTFLFISFPIASTKNENVQDLL